jgi:hypothetical protein
MEIMRTRRSKPMQHRSSDFFTLLPLKSDGIVADSLGTTKEARYLNNSCPHDPAHIIFTA